MSEWYAKVFELPKLELRSIPDRDICEPLSPGWMPVVNSANDAERPTVRCNCGVWINLREHWISQTGIVTPSILHKLCGWHVFARMKDWPGQRFQPETL